jgi:predicted dinucleotide-binding enzyme
MCLTAMEESIAAAREWLVPSDVRGWTMAKGSRMDIVMIGAGAMGRSLGTAFTRSGHSVTFVTRDPERSREVASGIGARSAASFADVIPACDVVVLAIQFGDASEALARALAPLVDGKVVVDVTNPMTADGSALAFDDGGSGAERFAEWMPDARVVKALNTVFAANMTRTIVDGIQLDGFVAADDAEAKAVVLDLVASIGLHGVDAGPLAVARSLEQLAWFNIGLNQRHSWAWDTGWRLAGVPSGADGST